MKGFDRLRSWVALGALAVLSASLASAFLTPKPASTAERSGARKPAVEINALTDTVIVFGPSYVVHDPEEDFGWTSYLDDFDVEDTLGRRYVLDIAEFDIDYMRVKVNSQEWFGQNEHSGATAQRLIDVVPGTLPIHFLMSGDEGEGASARVVRVSDPSYQTYPWTQFTKLVPADTQYASFSVDIDNAAPVGLLRAINGSASGSNRVTSCKVWLNGTQVLSNADFGTGRATATKNVTLLEDNTVEILNQSTSGTYLKLQFRAEDDTPPVLTLNWPPATLYTDSSTVTLMGSVADQTPYKLIVNGSEVDDSYATPGSFVHSVPLPSDGLYTIVVSVMNSAGLVTTTTLKVIRDTTAPTLVVHQPLSADTLVSTNPFTLKGYWLDRSFTDVAINGDTVSSAMDSSQAVHFTLDYPLDMGQNKIIFRATDALKHTTELTRHVFRVASNEPDPVDPDVDPSLATSAGIRPFLDQVSFLYLDDPPLQTGVVEDSIRAPVAAVVRGKVIGRDYTALPNVTVSVLGKPEFGETVTREDGWFDLVVNGGAPVILRFQKPGFLESQRRVETYVNDYSIVDDVAMVGRTEVVTAVDLTAGDVAKSRFATDANGDREMRLFFRPQTVAKVVRGEEDTVGFASINVRMTEYTIGGDGPEAMPAVLPPSSVYTYCVDLSVDEAEYLADSTGQVTAKVAFTSPVASYVRNFLHFPVGTRIPVGVYDGEDGMWKADSDGVVIRILATDTDTAWVDSNNDSLPDTQGQLDSLGIDVWERIQLAQHYAANDTLWRVSARHFSPRDPNPVPAPVPDPVSLGVGLMVKIGELLGLPTIHCGSIIECENCVLGEQIPIVGSPFTLNYRSYRAPGDKANRTVRVPVLGDDVPEGLWRIRVRMDVAGQRLEETLENPAANDSVTFVWDGLDAYGREVDESVTARIAVGYVYPAVMGFPGGGGMSWSTPASTGASAQASSGDREIGRVNWSRRTARLGVPRPKTDGLGGWTISPHHFYDSKGRGALYRGDGTAVLGESRPPIITKGFAGGGTYSGTDICRIRSDRKIGANDVAVGPDGSVYIADNVSHSIYVIRAGQDSICRIGGTGQTGSPFVDGGPATSTPLKKPKRLELGPDGSVYFVMNQLGETFSRVCRITPDGLIHTVAGTGEYSLTGSGDGGPATAAKFVEPTAIALGPDGSVFIADPLVRRVRRVDPNGIITTYAGTGWAGTSDSIGPATRIGIGATINGLAVDGNGTLYIAEYQRIRQVTRDGTMSTIVKYLNVYPNDIAIGPDGAMYIASGGGYLEQRVFRRDPDSTMSVVGGVPGAPAAEQPVVSGSYAAACRVVEPGGIGVGPDGAIYFGDAGNVSRVAPALGALIGDEHVVPSGDGAELYYFDLSGRHRRTRDALTGAVRYSFTHTSAGELRAIYDFNGDSTVVERSAGSPQKIIAPYGLETELTVDGNDYLRTVTNPESETITVTASADGLLASIENGENHRTDFTYGDDGRLQSESDPAGGSQALAKSTGRNSVRVTRTTELGRVTAYDVSSFYDAATLRRVTGPDAMVTAMSDSSDGRRRTVFPDGAVMLDSLGVDVRFGMLAPVVRAHRTVLPSGLARTVEVERPYLLWQFNPPTTQGTWKEEVSVNSRDPIVTTLNTTASPRRVTVRSADGRIVTAGVDSVGRPLSMTIAGLDSITYFRDSKGRDTLIAQAGRKVAFAYDAEGRVESVRDALGRMTSYTYDDADRILEQDLPGGRTVSFTYDDAGNLATLTPPGNPAAHSFTHTPVDLLEEYRPPGAGLGDSLTRYVYNEDRQLETIERPDGVDISIDYHVTTGRLESITIPRGSVDLDYDALGRTYTIESPDAVTLTYGHDGPIDTTESWSGSVTGTVSVTLDRDFRVAKQRVNGDTVGYAYDDDGLVTRAGKLTISRRADNGLISGTSLANSQITTSESQNEFGEPLNSTAEYGSTTLWDATYERDDLGRITGITETIDATTKVYAYAYFTSATSDTGFLTRVTMDGTVTERYGYDGNGNRTRFDTPGDSATALYDAQDRLLRYKNTAYSYSAGGELLRAITGSDTTLYTYDQLGNLLKVRFDTGDSVEYLIDGRNRRVARKFNGSTSHRWLYQNQLEPVAELDGTGNLVARFVYGTKAHVPDYFVKDNTTYRFVSDHLGSVRLVVNAATGAVVQRMDYDGYGRLTQDTNQGFQPFGYAGGLWDVETGLVRFGARDYDPRVGRWTSPDPIGFGGGSSNLMAYVDADPVNAIDPSGTSVQEDLDNLAGFFDCLTGGWASRLRNRFFPYHDVNSGSEAYAGGVESGRDVLISLAVGPAPKLVGRAAGAAAAFKTGHYATRLEAAGVNVARAEAAVASEMAAIRRHMIAGGDVGGRLTIDNVVVEYRARLLPNGTVSVGTIFPVR